MNDPELEGRLAALEVLVATLAKVIASKDGAFHISHQVTDARARTVERLSGSSNTEATNRGIDRTFSEIESALGLKP